METGLRFRPWWPPEELDTQVPEKQASVGFQLFTSLLRFGSGWFANHALQPTRAGALGSSRTARLFHRSVPAWLSLGR